MLLLENGMPERRVEGTILDASCCVNNRVLDDLLSSGENLGIFMLSPPLVHGEAHAGGDQARKPHNTPRTENILAYCVSLKAHRSGRLSAIVHSIQIGRNRVLVVRRKM